jgi:DNA polymerase I-like protein with 3'-5' exonuclease and polymerase domains
MQDAYLSGDSYLGFAKQSGAAPPDATKESHSEVREQHKQCVLAVQYGMEEDSLAVRINKPKIYARELLLAHHRTYRDFWYFSDGIVDQANLDGRLQTVLGWAIHVGPDANHRSLRNFPMQANAAEMLRLACCLATERGVAVCCPVHDALLIEAPMDQIEDTVAVTEHAMAEASRVILGGFELRTEVKVIRYPDRFTDKRGEAMWSAVWEEIRRLRR